MARSRVLIVEDDPFIALVVEDALTDEGYEVCGISASEKEALALAETTPPDFAVIDVSLRPGDGRMVARELFNRHGTIVLFATGQCEDVRDLARLGAVACLPKPYRAGDVPKALQAIARISRGEQPGPLPDHMVSLAPC